MPVTMARLRVFDVFGQPRGVVTEWEHLSVTRVLNGVSTGELVWHTNQARAGLLDAPFEVALEVFYAGEWVEPAGCRFFTSEATYIGTGGATVKAALTGIAGVLSFATVWDTRGNERREFTTVTPGRMLHDLFTEAKTRRDETGLVWGNGVISWSFTPETDSNGKRWPKNLRKSWAGSDDLLKPLAWLAEKGAIDWVMNARELSVYVGGSIGAVRPIRVRGKDTGEPASVSWRDLATVAHFRGDDGYELVKSAPDAERAFGRVERWSEQGQVSTAGTATMYLDAILEGGKSEQREYRAAWVIDTQHPTPLMAYSLGDWVFLDQAGSDVQVVEQGFELSPNGFVTGWDTYGTRLKKLLERLARRTTDLSSGQIGSDSGAPTPPEGARERIPTKPLPPVVTATQAILPNGAAASSIDISWQAVTTGANGKAVEGVTYELQTDVGEGWSTRIVEGVEDHFTGPASGKVRARVRALSGDGKPGAWSELTEVRIEHLHQPVTPPDGLSLSTMLGQVILEWNGTVTGGGTPPAGVQTLEITASTQGVAPVEGDAIPHPIGAQRYAVGSFPVGQEVRVWARLVDVLGNASDWVTVLPVPITVDGVNASDIVAGTVRTNSVLAGAISAAVGEFVSAKAGTVDADAATLTRAIIKHLKADTATFNNLWADLIRGRRIQADQIDGDVVTARKLRLGDYWIDASQLRGSATGLNTVGADRITSNDEVRVGSAFKVDRFGELQTVRLEVGNLSEYGPHVIINPGISGTQGVFLSSSGTAYGGTPGMFMAGRRLALQGQGSAGVLIEDLYTSASSQSTRSANTVIDAAGHVVASSSLRALKMHIQDLPVDEERFFEGVRPRFFHDKTEWETYQNSGESGVAPEWIAGVIAEELEAAGLNEFLTYNEDGELAGVAYDRAWLPLVTIIRGLRDRVGVLEERIARIEKSMGRSSNE